MKKLFSILLVLSLSMTMISGCGHADENIKDQNKHPTEQVTTQEPSTPTLEDTTNKLSESIAEAAEKAAEIAKEEAEKIKEENNAPAEPEDSTPVEDNDSTTEEAPATEETLADADVPPQAEPEPEVQADTQETAQTCTVELTGTYHYAEAYKMLELVNNYRAEHGVDPVEWDENLAYAGKTRAAEASICWAHSRPDGTAWKTVSEYTHGENLAKGYDNAEAVFQAWLNSPSHRDNLLIPQFHTMYVAFFDTSNGWFWAQEFGF